MRAGSMKRSHGTRDVESGSRGISTHGPHPRTPTGGNLLHDLESVPAVPGQILLLLRFEISRGSIFVGPLQHRGQEGRTVALSLPGWIAPEKDQIPVRHVHALVDPVDLPIEAEAGRYPGSDAVHGTDLAQHAQRFSSYTSRVRARWKPNGSAHKRVVNRRRPDLVVLLGVDDRRGHERQCRPGLAERVGDQERKNRVVLEGSGEGHHGSGTVVGNHAPHRQWRRPSRNNVAMNSIPPATSRPRRATKVRMVSGM